jgi:hypothetical protein
MKSSDYIDLTPDTSETAIIHFPHDPRGEIRVEVRRNKYDDCELFKRYNSSSDEEDVIYTPTKMYKDNETTYNKGKQRDLLEPFEYSSSLSKRERERILDEVMFNIGPLVLIHLTYRRANADRHDPNKIELEHDIKYVSSRLMYKVKN